MVTAPLSQDMKNSTLIARARRIFLVAVAYQRRFMR
jgi:hypothetical protein